MRGKLCEFVFELLKRKQPSPKVSKAVVEIVLD